MQLNNKKINQVLNGMCAFYSKIEENFYRLLFFVIVSDVELCSRKQNVKLDTICP